MSAIKANQVLNLDGDRIGSVVVDSIANMKNLNTEIEANATVEVLGYYSKGDGGGGTFYWDSTSIEDDNGGTIIEATGVVDGRWIRNYSGAVNVKWFGAKGDESVDSQSSIQNAINYAIKQYDTTETTYDQTNVVYRGKNKTLYFPSGRYRIDRTLNLSFRNDFEIIGDGKDTWLVWGVYGDSNPAESGGMMVDARCSSQTRISNINLDGYHRAKVLWYQAGNGVNAANSKGNVTNIFFDSMSFFNQDKTLLDNGSQEPDKAMLCLVSLEGDTWYNSVDDSRINNCTFSNNWGNGGYGISVSTSAVNINDCLFYGNNGVLGLNGASFFMNGCMGSLGSAPVGSAHGFIVLGAGLFSNIVMTNCYLESPDYYMSDNPAQLLYCEPSADTTINSFVASNCSIGIAEAAKEIITVSGNAKANITIRDCQVQGSVGYGYIYAPTSNVSLFLNNMSTSTEDNYNRPLIVTAYASLDTQLSNPTGIAKGTNGSAIMATVSYTIDSTKYKFFTLQQALETLNNTDEVTVYVEKDTTISDIYLKGRVRLELGSNTLSLSGLKVERGGHLAIIGGTIATSSYGFFNRGEVIIQNTSIEGSTFYNYGKMTVIGTSTFNTTGTCIQTGDGAITKIDEGTCTFSGTGKVASLGTVGGEVVLYNYSGGTPTTGLWERGTKLQYMLPSAGFPNIKYATADGIGAAASWVHQGNLAT
jgi:hypothetical protein